MLYVIKYVKRKYGPSFSILNCQAGTAPSPPPQPPATPHQLITHHPSPHHPITPYLITPSASPNHLSPLTPSPPDPLTLPIWASPSPAPGMAPGVAVVVHHAPVRPGRAMGRPMVWVVAKGRPMVGMVAMGWVAAAFMTHVAAWWPVHGRAMACGMMRDE